MEQRKLVENIARKTLSLMGFEGDVVIGDDGEKVRVAIETNEAGMLIGRGGENLRALQHLLLLMVSKEMDYNFSPGRFVLDVNNYQKEREGYLIALAKNTAYEVKETKKAKELQPMPPSERRLVHVTLADEQGVMTESIGQEKERKVVVKPL